jgi:hypothetical protein
MSVASPFLTGCTTHFEKSLEVEFKRLEQLQEPTATVTRTADTPLVAAIPGLNVPLAPVGAAQFGQLPEMLEREGIPFFIVAYDEKIHPLSAMSGLYSEQYSIASTRVLPILSAAIEKENEIRRSQNVPDLKKLVIVSYSQGSVLGLDVIRGFAMFRLEWLQFIEQVGKEWDRLKTDPEFILLRDSISNFLMIDKIRIERPKEYKRSYDFQRLYRRLSDDSKKAFERFQHYILSPDTNNRSYPKIAKWFERYDTVDKIAPTRMRYFWTSYLEYEQLLPLQLRLFSLAGSFFGTGEANIGYGMLEVLPFRGELLVGPIVGQVKDTQLGTRYHLEVIKDLFTLSGQVEPERVAENLYFIVGVNNNKGDGLVPEFSAHFSSHLFTEISIEDLLQVSKGKSQSFKVAQLPDYPLTGLKVHHLPGREFFFFEKPGIAQMNEKSKAYPYLMAFIRKDRDKLERLHQSQQQPMRQFMVVVNLPPTGEMNQCGFKLTSASDQVKITGHYYNRTSHALAWTGIFKSDKSAFTSAGNLPTPSADIVLRISKLKENNIDVRLVIEPGIIHFVEIGADSSKKELVNSSYGATRETAEIYKETR